MAVEATKSVMRRVAASALFAAFFVPLALGSSTALADELSGPSCAVESRAGVSQEDAEAIEEIVCAEVRSRVEGGRYRVRIARLGGKVVLTLAADTSAHGRAEKQLVLSELEEVPVAAPRLVDGVLENKPIAETQTVTNVVGVEARTSKKKASEVHVQLGMMVAGAFGGEAGAGAHLSMTGGSDRWSFVGDLRLAGYSFSAPIAAAAAIFSLGMVEMDPDDDAFAYASLTGGVRHHLSASDSALFLGLGLGYDYLRLDGRKDWSKDGAALYAEIGADFLRTHWVGGMIGLRFDAPAFTIDGASPSVDAGGKPLRVTHENLWAPIGSVTLSLRF